VVVPLVMELLLPQSVCDVGCGRGIWLAVFEQQGVDEVLGIDGAEIDRERLAIDADKFVVADLEQGVPAAGSFDLAVSLEVGEHLSQPAAETFVEGLVALAPAVLFSAAVPGQGGQRHINEQWPEYWRALFAEHDYVPIDCVRPRIWREREVRVWYRQNTLLFASHALIESRENLRNELERSADMPLSVVHPRLFEITMQRPWQTMLKLTAELEAGKLTEQELREELASVLSGLAERVRAVATRP
jgi:SAM-dependent methyltransferase